MTTDPYPIWVTEAHRKTPLMVADEFARGYFADPREVTLFMETAEFRLFDGMATYRVVYQAGVPGVSTATYGVFRV